MIDEREGRGRISWRASQVLVGDGPLGPFKPFANQPHTPEGEMTLDATLWVEDGQPWLVYCHEWVQVTEGMVKAIRLKEDLSATVGEPMILIRASDVPWTKNNIQYRGERYPGYVTDGPWFHRTMDGALALMWSSWSVDRQYATAFAYSKSGKLFGPWEHEPQPQLWDDRGHGSIFRTFDGHLRMTVHRYFHQPETRMQIYELRDTGLRLEVGEQLLGYP